ncbi:MAG: LysR family transcriptional regulator [Firmicutes bacterium]|nr:LysR family transcriptional regulator [Bacillota bacterium]
MDFHQLRVFVEVAKQKNFSRAAENIFLSQPTVSAHIKALENEIGSPLFDRSQRELMLTEGGKILFKFAQEILEIKERALAAIQENYRITKGHLEIAASSVPGAYLLPGLLRSFNKKHPGVTFSVLLRDSRHVFESIRDYTYDLGFAGKPARMEGLGQVKLVEDQLILIAPPGTNLAGETGAASGLPSVKPEACLGYPFVLREPGSATRLVFEKALQKQFGSSPGLRVAAYLEGQEAIKEAVKTGLGLTVISRMAVEEELRSGSLEGYTLEGLTMERYFYLIYRKKRVLPPLSRAFLEFTMEYFGISPMVSNPSEQ